MISFAQIFVSHSETRLCKYAVKSVSVVPDNLSDNYDLSTF